MVDFTREEVKTALEEYASTLAGEEEDEFIDDDEEHTEPEAEETKKEKDEGSAEIIEPEENLEKQPDPIEIFEGKNLSGLDLSEINFLGISLKGTNLNKTNPVSYTHLTLPTIYSV